MSYSGSTNGLPPFDPWLQPELFRGVLTRRVFAFPIDLVVLALPVVLACAVLRGFGPAGIRVPDRSGGAVDPGDSGLRVHRGVRRGHAGARLGAVLADIAS